VSAGRGEPSAEIATHAARANDCDTHDPRWYYGGFTARGPAKAGHYVRTTRRGRRRTTRRRDDETTRRREAYVVSAFRRTVVRYDFDRKRRISRRRGECDTRGMQNTATVQPLERLNDEARWRAVERRDRSADGMFVYAVRSTGVYCRPSCPS